MDAELRSIINRANELFEDLVNEYNECLKNQTITERAKNLTHEILERLRNALDHTMCRLWEKNSLPNLSDIKKKKARVYFPIVNDLDSFRSTLGRAFMLDLETTNNNLYTILLNKQPFSSKENQWLSILANVTNEGKHVKLVPQKRIVTERIRVSRQNGSSVSWSKSNVKFGSGVKVLDAPIDPKTQRIIPTSGVTEQIEVWVSFILNGFGVNALTFCKDAVHKVNELVEELVNT